MPEELGTTRTNEVRAEILKWIAEGHYLEGSWLPSIARLCDTLQVSDTTVKRALTLLKRRGVVKGVNGRGVRVCRRRKTVLVLSLLRLLKGLYVPAVQYERAIHEALKSQGDRSIF